VRRLLREVHAELLRDTRGSDKNPGELRSSQNWVGPAGCAISEAAYVPPNVEDMHDALSGLEKFINEEDPVDPIVKAALVHYQFETIHPFLDGNGRLGRLLITLSLMNDGVLTRASFYPSYQLKVRRSEYYKRLMGVRERGEYVAWIDFFCSCLSDSAHDASDTLERLSDLHEETERRIDSSLGRSGANARRLLSLLEANPIVRASFIADRLEVSSSTANNLVAEFTRMGFLRQLDERKQRYRVFAYEDYLALLRKGDQPLSQGEAR
jgi:Fic family protein